MSSAVRQLVEAGARFPLAMLAFGMQQGARVLSEERAAERSLYLVSQAAQRELSDILLASFQIGDAIQREFVDTVFRVLCLEPGRRPVTAEVESVLRSLCRLPPANFRLAWQELRNKMQVFNLVRRARDLLREPNAGPLPLLPLIDRAYALPDYQRVWAVEGLGHDYAATFTETAGADGILTSGQADALPSKSLTMMHAGMGLAFAQWLWEGISPYDSEERIQAAVALFDRRCAANSREGYTGAARESLGLVTQTVEPHIVPAADAVIRAHAPGLAGFFWHGAGRALYFSATHFIPGLTSPWSGILRRASHATGACNMIAGLAWATALVNLRNPEIVADLAAKLDRSITDTGAFTNGVSSSLMMAYDIDPANPWIEPFLNYVPPDQNAASVWTAVVQQPCRYALERIYPDLKNRSRLEDLFHCAPTGRQ